jgi:PAS domain S-box-containing protein
MKPWWTADDRVGGALLAAELITEEVEAKHAVAESEARFRATFENAAVGISHFTPDGRLLRGNNAMSRILGWPADELVTKSFQEVTHLEDLAVELAQLEQLRDGKIDSYSLDKRYLRKDGTTVWTRRTVSCVRKSDGSIDYLVSAIEDISARKHAEERLHLLMREANHRVKISSVSCKQLSARLRQPASPSLASASERSRPIFKRPAFLQNFRAESRVDLTSQLHQLIDRHGFEIVHRDHRLSFD